MHVVGNHGSQQRCEPNQMVAAYNSANTYVFDMETAKQVIKLDSLQETGEYRINTAKYGLGKILSEYIYFCSNL